MPRGKRTSPGTYPVRRWMASVSCWASRPNRRTVPAVGRMKSSMARIVVLFPAPLGPRKPKISPRATLSEMLFTACTEPYALAKRSISIADGPASNASTPEADVLSAAALTWSITLASPRSLVGLDARPAARAPSNPAAPAPTWLFRLWCCRRRARTPSWHSP